MADHVDAGIIHAPCAEQRKAEASERFEYYVLVERANVETSVGVEILPLSVLEVGLQGVVVFGAVIDEDLGHVDWRRVSDRGRGYSTWDNGSW